MAKKAQAPATKPAAAAVKHGTAKKATAGTAAKAPARATASKAGGASSANRATHASPAATDTANGSARDADSTASKKAAPARRAAAPAEPALTLPPVKGETKDGIKYTKDFDVKFLTAQLKLLLEARESLVGQAVRLEDEANSLIDEEMGDVQFDDESGEGDTMVVERERDLFLSARARNDVEEIDAAIARLATGSYGYSVVSFKPIPRERLEAIPWATELTQEKVGGIGRR